jgi:hypothetical protein
MDAQQAETVIAPEDRASSGSDRRGWKKLGGLALEYGKTGARAAAEVGHRAGSEVAQSAHEVRGVRHWQDNRDRLVEATLAVQEAYGLHGPEPLPPTAPEPGPEVQPGAGDEEQVATGSDPGYDHLYRQAPAAGGAPPGPPRGPDGTLVMDVQPEPRPERARGRGEPLDVTESINRLPEGIRAEAKDVLDSVGRILAAPVPEGSTMPDHRIKVGAHLKPEQLEPLRDWLHIWLSINPKKVSDMRAKGNKVMRYYLSNVDHLGVYEVWKKPRLRKGTLQSMQIIVSDGLPADMSRIESRRGRRKSPWGPEQYDGGREDMIDVAGKDELLHEELGQRVVDPPHDMFLRTGDEAMGIYGTGGGSEAIFPENQPTRTPARLLRLEELRRGRAKQLDEFLKQIDENTSKRKPMQRLRALDQADETARGYGMMKGDYEVRSNALRRKLEGRQFPRKIWTKKEK